MRPVLALVGPTASGKSEAALSLAAALDAEIVSADSMLVYRGMDIGTAKPSAADRARIPHHLIDVVDPSEPFSVARYQLLARAAVRDIQDRGRRVLLVGGSGLYLRAVVDDLEFPGTDPQMRRTLEAEAAIVGADELYRRLTISDPSAAAKIEPANVRRTIRALEVAAITGRRFSTYADAWERYPAGRLRVIGLELARPVIAERARGRVASMMEAGFLGEVAGLVERGLGSWLTASQAIGYAEMARHLDGRIGLEDAVAGTITRTTRLARRQMAWFRRDPRIRWVRAGHTGAVGALEELLAGLEDG